MILDASYSWRVELFDSLLVASGSGLNIAKLGNQTISLKDCWFNSPTLIPVIPVGTWSCNHHFIGPNNKDTTIPIGILDFGHKVNGYCAASAIRWPSIGSNLIKLV